MAGHEADVRVDGIKVPGARYVAGISIAGVVMVSPLAARRITLSCETYHAEPIPGPPGAAETSAVRPAWITGGKLPPRPLPGVVLFPFDIRALPGR